MKPFTIKAYGERGLFPAGSQESSPERGFIMQQYFLYILFSQKLNKYYVGSTSSIEERLELHNSGNSKFTAMGIPWKLVYCKTFSCRHDAMVREYEIKKKKSRKYIEWLISQNG